ncbi:MAG: 30S ribosomal protein S16, partial [Candidatus Marinimicrobia bacterium]|nr:30S ribosomal protein S16 [Candidatus Neomarinimicrobiota bacterium]
MATKIRLKRIGRKNRPFYRLVVMDERARRDGAAIEQLGWFNPLELDDEKNYALNDTRIIHWLQEGAQTTETAHNLLKRTGLAYRWHLIRQGLDEAAVEKEMKKWALEKTEVEKSRSDKAAKKA